MLNIIFRIISAVIVYRIFEPILGSDIWWFYLAMFLWELEVNIDLNTK
jgi:hypothetical protein